MSDSLLNRTAVRKFTLDTIKVRRPHLAAKKTRISEDYFVRVEARLRAAIQTDIDNLNSTGKTIA